jgi:hypothetical protein
MKRFLVAIVFVCTGFAAVAQTYSIGVERLWSDLRMRDVIAVMREEGIAYGGELDAAMLQSAGGLVWVQYVEARYELVSIEAAIKAEFAKALDGKDLAPILTFYASELGTKVSEMEVGARRAMLDDKVDQAARDYITNWTEEDAPRQELLSRYIEVNQLVETNVVGSMNSNLAFYQGMLDAGSAEMEVGMDSMLADVWAQEDSMRMDTEEWLYAFLNLAYDPLNDVELQAYVTFCDSKAGQILNQALFSAFDPMFNKISYSLGLGIGQFMVGERL